jgi:hypothetical protein
MEKRNNKSTHLMESIRKWVEKKKIVCYTSFFLSMELSDTKKDDLYFQEAINKRWEFKKIMREKNNPCLEDHHFKKISEYTDNLEETYPFLSQLLLSKEGWQVALSISSYSNIWSPDAIHLATALSNDCDLLITNDSQFREEANKVVKKFTKYNLKVVEVEEAQKIIEENLK